MPIAVTATVWLTAATADELDALIVDVERLGLGAHTPVGLLAADGTVVDTPVADVLTRARELLDHPLIGGVLADEIALCLTVDATGTLVADCPHHRSVDTTTTPATGGPAELRLTVHPRCWDHLHHRPALHPDGTATLVGGQRLVNVHRATSCAGEHCVLHNPSDHPMRTWPQQFRGHTERLCQHGVGHPDPDDPFAPAIHGCDGCCAPPGP